MEQPPQNLSSRPHGHSAGDALNADMGLGFDLQVFWFECKPRDGSSTGPAGVVHCNVFSAYGSQSLTLTEMKSLPFLFPQGHKIIKVGKATKII